MNTEGQKSGGLSVCLYELAQRADVQLGKIARLSPLRRIVMRELDVYQPDPRNPKYLIYSLIDTLECGHTKGVYLWNGLLDVLNAYTDNPAARARRHRCRPCASLLATKKLPASVGLRIYENRKGA